jgi:hypothetical protein
VCRAPPAVKDYFDHIYVDLNGYIHTVGRYACNPVPACCVCTHN